MNNIKRLLFFDIKGDMRGSLIALENNKEIPFDIKRVYYIFGTKKGVARGFHAHRNLQQVLVCVSGSCIVKLDNGNTVEELKLDSPNIGLVVDKMIWHEMYDFSENCVLMVLASDFYDEEDYIRDYTKYIRTKSNKINHILP